jgi:hypothetical protein
VPDSLSLALPVSLPLALAGPLSLSLTLTLFLAVSQAPRLPLSMYEIAAGAACELRAAACPEPA